MSSTMSSVSTYNVYARYTFKTPGGWPFTEDKTRWLAAEVRRNLRVRHAVKTTPAWATTGTKTHGQDADAAAKRKASDEIEDQRAAKKARMATTSERNAKRKATRAANGERAAKKVKTHHEVRWCTSVQEPRETVRPKIARVLCPNPNPIQEASGNSPLTTNARIENMATTPATTTQMWPWPKVPMGRSRTFEDAPAVRPGQAKPKKRMVLRYSDDHSWNRNVVIPPWSYRHAEYHQLLMMHAGLERWIKYMAKRQVPMAQLLVAACA
ncbi:hypothetical protein C8T65DRAFT_639503 [Cerioporus squamosus]|nr:hypothetical protein C8T65DRAFT_639503 [Cerioporus squamosus]